MANLQIAGAGGRGIRFEFCWVGLHFYQQANPRVIVIFEASDVTRVSPLKYVYLSLHVGKVNQGLMPKGLQFARIQFCQATMVCRENALM